MVITPDPELEAALSELARRQGISPEALALNVLRRQFLMSTPPASAQDEWERRLRDVASDCGVSLPHSALSSEGLYE